MKILDWIYEIIGQQFDYDKIKLRTIVGSIPNELQHIYDICSNEIALCDDVKIKQFYIDIYYQSVLIYFAMCRPEMDKNTKTIANKYLEYSSSTEEANDKFIELSDQYHELNQSLVGKNLYPARFLKSRFDVHETLKKIITSKFVDTELSDEFSNSNLMKQTIEIKRI